jgi:hypothetical protein
MCQGSPSILGGLGGELAVIILQGLSENMLNESRYLPKLEFVLCVRWVSVMCLCCVIGVGRM